MLRCSVTSVYKPPNTEFKFIEPKIVIGDFNCHSVVWGYHNTNSDGEILEEWVESQNLKRIHDPKLPASFNSGRWRRGYNPDIYVTDSIAKNTSKHVENHIPKTQHRPLTCTITAAVKPETVPFKKTNWNQYTEYLDKQLFHLTLILNRMMPLLILLEKYPEKTFLAAVELNIFQVYKMRLRIYWINTKNFIIWNHFPSIQLKQVNFSWKNNMEEND